MGGAWAVVPRRAVREKRDLALKYTIMGGGMRRLTVDGGVLFTFAILLVCVSGPGARGKSGAMIFKDYCKKKQMLAGIP